MDPVTADSIALLQAVGHELLLAAAVGILIFGIEDLAFDMLWFFRRLRSPLAVDAPLDGTIAVFVPAWQEAAVLPATLTQMLAAWQNEDVRIFIGCYPNDSATLFAVSSLVARNPRLRLAVSAHDGPTSKADNLNRLWQALGEDERAGSFRFAAVVLHDAEDIVHGGELALFRRYLPGAAMVQIPVEPVIGGAGLIAAHYADEFAEAHRKEMPLRAELAAALPAAGVGCAFSRQALMQLALDRPDGPFNADSLTEDYEAGLILGATGGQCRFIDRVDASGIRIATRSAFPATLEASVRQKGRWIAGIALGGWDRLDLRGAQTGGQPRQQPRTVFQLALVAWMLWRDRRSPLAALVTMCAYAALVLASVDQAGQWFGLWPASSIEPMLLILLGANGLLLLWRLMVRAMFTASVYGWRQGVLAVPRALVANIIHILAARRAMMVYLRQLRRGQLVWDKTEHRPALPAKANAVRFGAPQ